MTEQVREILGSLFLTGRNAPPQDASAEIEATSAAQDLLDHLKQQPELQVLGDDTKRYYNDPFRKKFIVMLERELGGDDDS